ncbi:MAG: DVU0298 family protein [Desulfotomaculales bacterium]
MNTLKQRIVALLRAGDWDGLIATIRVDRKAWSYLIRALYLPDEFVGWRAVEGFGRAVAMLADSDTETCREMFRRLFWALNDESGTSGRRVAPAVGEAVARRPDVFGEYALIIWPALEEPFLQASVAWALGRIGQVDPELVRKAVPDLVSLLDSPDHEVRGHAAWALGEIGVREAGEKIAALAGDAGEMKIFLAGELRRVTVGALARTALRKLM